MHARGNILLVLLLICREFGKLQGVFDSFLLLILTFISLHLFLRALFFSFSSHRSIKTVRVYSYVNHHIGSNDLIFNCCEYNHMHIWFLAHLIWLVCLRFYYKLNYCSFMVSILKYRIKHFITKILCSMLTRNFNAFYFIHIKGLMFVYFILIYF